jgi:hypothetical protein
MRKSSYLQSFSLASSRRTREEEMRHRGWGLQKTFDTFNGLPLINEVVKRSRSIFLNPHETILAQDSLSSMNFQCTQTLHASFKSLGMSFWWKLNTKNSFSDLSPGTINSP